jgi:hypothetical protein
MAAALSLTQSITLSLMSVCKEKGEMEREKKERKKEGGVHMSFGRSEEIRLCYPIQPCADTWHMQDSLIK